MKVFKPIFLFTFLLGLFACKEPESKPSSAPQKTKPRIGILPLGKTKKELIAEAESAVKKSFNMEVIILDAVSLPEHTRSPFAPSRYRADSLLHYMDREFGSAADKIIGITQVDISCTKNKEPAWKYRDWGVFGLGSCPGKTCIVSSFRLGARNAGKELILDRFRKVCIHELGHTFGLPHCPEKGCVMSDAAESIATVDGESERFCEKCRNQLH